MHVTFTCCCDFRYIQSYGYINSICELIQKHIFSDLDNWGTFFMNDEVQNSKAKRLSSNYQPILCNNNLTQSSVEPQIEEGMLS